MRSKEPSFTQSFGLVAVILVMVGDVAALASMSPAQAIVALVIAGAISRSGEAHQDDSHRVSHDTTLKVQNRKPVVMPSEKAGVIRPGTYQRTRARAGRLGGSVVGPNEQPP